jgi:hypothetical protein
MNRTNLILGYGFSLEGREADWEELEAELPVRGPNCPLTADLLEFALGQVQSPQEADRLRVHVSECVSCRNRLDVQQRAVRRAESLRAATPAATLQEQVAADFRARRKPHRRGAMRPVSKLLLADSGKPVALLAPNDPGLPPLNAVLQWSKPDPNRNDSPWYVTLRLPSQALEPTWGNPESELEELSGYLVRLTFWIADRKPGLSVEARLDWDAEHKQLVSHRPERVALSDPQAVTDVEFFPVERIKGLDMS